MKLKTLLNKIEFCRKDKQLTKRESLKFKAILDKIWNEVTVGNIQKHHLNGRKDSTPFNMVKINGSLHQMLHENAYRYIYASGSMKKYALWLKKEFYIDIDNFLKLLKTKKKK